MRRLSQFVAILALGLLVASMTTMSYAGGKKLYASWVNVGTGGPMADAVADGDLAAGISTIGGLFYDASGVSLTIGAGGTGTLSVPGDGANSEMLGSATSAAGARSLSVGYLAVAGSGAGNIAIGDAATGGTSAGSIAIGDGAGAGHLGNIALGLSSSAPSTGSYTISAGQYSSATKTGAIAIGGGGSSGQGAQATNNGAVSIGPTSAASGARSVAIGNNPACAGQESVAIGDVATASAESAVALGDGAIADQARSVALGDLANTDAADQLMLGSAGTPMHIAMLADSAAPSGGAGKGIMWVTSTTETAVVNSATTTYLDASYGSFWITGDAGVAVAAGNPTLSTCTTEAGPMRGWSMPQNNQLNYNASQTRDFKFSLSYSQTVDAGSQVVTTWIAKNDVIQPETCIDRKSGVGASDIGAGGSCWIMSAAGGDRFEIYVTDAGGNTIALTRGQLVVTSVN